ncbi:MAG TPA: hypothetical protein VH853_07835 [Polyangia bacterium]|jgi:hypothetical protein|nr:hypothetical protein [Polyangia bacterium]
MADVGLFDGIWRDLTGRGMFGGKFQIRLILQPVVALLLGIRFGIRDAKQGKDDPFFMSLVHAGHHDRWPILKQGLRDAIVPLCVAFVLDAILQQMILGHVRLLGAVVVGSLLVFLPFVIGRGLGHRIWRHGHHTRQIPHSP